MNLPSPVHDGALLNKISEPQQILLRHRPPFYLYLWHRLILSPLAQGTWKLFTVLLLYSWGLRIKRGS